MDGAQRLVLLSIILLFLLVPFSVGLSRQTYGGNSVSVMYLSPLRSTGQSFIVAVSMNLSSTDGISGYDVIIKSNVYNDTRLPYQVLNPQSIMPGNVFQGRQNLALSNCVNLVGSGCDPTKGDDLGAVHSAMVVLGDPIPPGQSVTLFYVNYTVVGKGVSMLEIGNENVTYVPSVPGYGPNTLPVVHLNYDGIFSNNGLAAFFNIAMPAIPVVGAPVTFDASGSFNSNGVKIAGYQWNFGDGNKAIVGGSEVSHVYDHIGSYNVSLNVTDGGSWKVLTRILRVSSMLGALRIQTTPVAAKGAVFYGNITVTLYNITGSSSILFRSLVKVPSVQYVQFSGLKPGLYRADFSGDGVTPISKTETVSPGQTSWDTVYVPVTVPQPSTPLDPLPFVLAIFGAGTILAGVALFRSRRSMRKPVKTVKPVKLKHCKI